MTRNYKKIFKQWKLERKPYFEHKIEALDLSIKRYKIYEDEKIKLCRVFNPTYQSEEENYIQLFIKKPFMIMNFEIGGCINVSQAIYSAELIVSKLVKY